MDDDPRSSAWPGMIHLLEPWHLHALRPIPLFTGQGDYPAYGWLVLWFKKNMLGDMLGDNY
jgi:hypothetical protein